MTDRPHPPAPPQRVAPAGASRHRVRRPHRGQGQSTPERSGQRQRTCVGCGQLDRPVELVRMVVSDQGEVAFDLAGGAFGRGAWAHPTPSCLERAARRGLARSLRRAVPARDLAARLACAAERRAIGLLSGARAAGQLAVGADAVAEACACGRAQLVVLAQDAQAAERTPAVQQALAGGAAVRFANKADLGAALGRADIAVVAVLQEGLAHALRRAIGQARLVEGEPGYGATPSTPHEDVAGVKVSVASSTEVR